MPSSLVRDAASPIACDVAFLALHWKALSTSLIHFAISLRWAAVKFAASFFANIRRLLDLIRADPANWRAMIEAA
ncbi:MAG TPA: hypothetical protein VG326_09455 [Tepidisphaeraceae bacterium]|jgi:hypothetical protein|nr:hypothetical protein [Tepidisphaeraceae bacterium]